MWEAPSINHAQTPNGAPAEFKLRFRSMNRRTFRFILSYFFTFLTLLSSASAKAKPAKENIEFEGRHRTYWVFAPDNLNSPAPLLLLLHGSGRDGLSLVDPWRSLAEKMGIVLVAPDSYNSQVWDQSKDGPDFLHAIVENVRAKYPVDGRRLYMFGHSAGASFALYMAVIESEYFAATAVHAGGIRPEDYHVMDFAKRQIPIGIWVGTEDQFFPLRDVRATQQAFKAHGIPAQLTELPRHDHNYYAISRDINGQIWEFLAAQKLSVDPEYQQYLH